MSDKLYTYPVNKLLKWILADLEQNKIFGYSRELFFEPDRDHPFQLNRYGRLLESPIGVAAGPHTQMSQNIILSWLFGARYIELKTVQTLDELEIAKPCIDMVDEGYNCEWSQELKIQQSFDEYLNAWIIIHILRDIFGWDSKELGTIFNISVGYNLEGILKDNVQWFLDKMENCEEELNSKIELLSKTYPRVKSLNIPSRISDNITLSTMHGCPPDEIESIATYLIKERKLNTAIKLNPTLLGSDEVRRILNEKLKFDLVVPNQAFEHDLKWEEAITIIERLTKLAKAEGVEFGLKLTNTLESLNIERFLPSKEKMVYMSGRALHPISINLAAKLQNHFKGRLDISFSAGVDAFNVAETLKCNLRPITVCSDLLKPGGYSRLTQYMDELLTSFKKANANSLDEFILSSSNGKDIAAATLANLNLYAAKVIDDNRYSKQSFNYDNIKTGRELTVFDCVHSPCVETCAISQDVPEYMYYTSKGEFSKAFDVIQKTNPLPNITGMVCDHLCQSKCTRINYDTPLLIREIKRFIADKAGNDFKLKRKGAIPLKAAIVGAGPAGLSAAYFLAHEGMEVNVYEAKNIVGGMAGDAIPVFRITKEAIERDLEHVQEAGAVVHLNTKVDKKKFEEIKNNNDFVFISVGAQKGKKLGIEGENLSGVYDQINFLADVIKGDIPELGKSVAIIGGGLSAVDAARTAKRLLGADGEVRVLYRRTRNEMPCGWEEANIMEEEGIEIVELTSPVKITNADGKLNLTCLRMQLSGVDADGRRKPIPVACSDFNLQFDSIITAIGQEVDLDFLPERELRIDQITNETQYKNIFAGGDLIRGADSLINAIADGQKVAGIILERAKKKLNLSLSPEKKLSETEFQKKLAKRQYGIEIPTIPLEERLSFDLVHPLLSDAQAIEEASRCLFCNDVCNICVTVCPNYANISVETEPVEIKIASANKTFKVEQTTQIINIGDFCNECGNCETFCPTSGAPYKTKPKFYLSGKSFANESKGYLLTGNKLIYKEPGIKRSIKIENNKIFYSGNGNFEFDKNLNIINGVEPSTSEWDSITEMYYLLTQLTKNKSLSVFLSD